jgi:hypothetical protein
MKGKLALSCLLVLLAAMAVTPQTTGTTLVVTFDTSNDPLCTLVQTTDCIGSARIFYLDPQGNELRAPGPDITAVAFAVVSGATVAGTTPVPSIPGQRYGATTFIARMVAKDAAGNEVLSDPSTNVAVVRRPPRPAGFSVK